MEMLYNLFRELDIFLFEKSIFLNLNSKYEIIFKITNNLGLYVKV